MAIPNVLANGKSYKHGFTKKRDDHKLYAKSRAKSCFDQFFMYYLGISKYWSFPIYYPMGSRTSMVSRKNVTIINFT
ncbi:hypothetical protein GW17_00048668 [Ensete ventricosum]|nr:hypothetical protein GW17_00048668 [Ensete ventricosum]